MQTACPRSGMQSGDRLERTKTNKSEGDFFTFGLFERTL